MIIKDMASEKKEELLSFYAEQAKIITRITIWQYCNPNAPQYHDSEKYSTLLEIKSNRAQNIPIQDIIEDMYALTDMYLTAVKEICEKSSEHDSLLTQVKDLQNMHKNGCVPIYKSILGKETSRMNRVMGAVSSVFGQTETQLDYSTPDKFISLWDTLYDKAVADLSSEKDIVPFTASHTPQTQEIQQ